MLVKILIIFFPLFFDPVIVDSTQQITGQSGHIFWLFLMVRGSVLQHLLVVSSGVMFVSSQNMFHAGVGVIRFR